MEKLKPKDKAEEILKYFSKSTNHFFCKDIAIMYVDTLMRQEQYKHDLNYWNEVRFEIKRFV